MIKKLFVAGLAYLTLSCAPVASKQTCPERSKTESIQYNCYPKKHFAAVSYHNNGKILKTLNWGRDKNAGCFGTYAVGIKNKGGKYETKYLILFQDRDCDGKFEDAIDLSKEEFTGNFQQTFKDILTNLRNRKKTKTRMQQCLSI
jgi:hypothetical protein